MNQIALIAGGIGTFAGIMITVIIWGRTHHGGGSTTALASTLRNEKLKSDILLNAIDDGVMLVDNQGTIQLFNPAASKITGWPISEATGLDYQTVFRLVDDKNVAYTEERSPIHRVFQVRTGLRDNTPYLVSRTNVRLPVSLSVSPLLDGQSGLNGVVVIFRDVSQERGEEQRRAEFISTASHEMRTPVAAIEGYLSLALNEKVSRIDTKAREYIDKAHASTQHLGKLFQDLLTSAKAEDGRLTSHPNVIEMGEFLEKLVEDFRFAAEKKNLILEFIVGSGGIHIDARRGGNKVIRPFYYVYADPDRVREAITNLFDNAIKYTEAGKVSIGITGDEQVVQVRVNDTGPGIPAEDIPHLFQKFYRVDNSVTRTIGGTGLGLFITRKVIELYNGKIWVESTPGKGSTFFINLPRLTSQRADQLKVQEAAKSPLENLSSAGKI
jgi:two-component system, OmpR family, sensor histidine kinase VicK